MKIRPGVDMMEALRLTREGRLEEAMAVLRGDAAPVAAGSVKKEADNGMAPVLDMVPPSLETGRAWTAPPTRASLRSDATRRRLFAVDIDARRISGSPAQVRPSGRMGACSRRAEAGEGCCSPWGDVRDRRLCQRGRQPEVQTVCAELLQRRAAAPGGDAARLYPVAR